jgi:hypothetical protein
MKPWYANIRRLPSLPFCLLCMMPIIVACSDATVSTPTITVAAITPSVTVVPSSMPKGTSTQPSTVPSPMGTLEPPLPTAGPTLGPDKEQSLVLDLLANNAGCQLPCWWGMAPGKTTWRAAQSYFASIGKSIARFENNEVTNYTVKFRAPQHNMQIGQVYNVNKDGLIDMIWVRGAVVRDDVRIYGDPQFLKDWQHYMPARLANTFGMPEQVMMKTFQSVPEGAPPFNLLVFYPQHGILVRYYGPTEQFDKTIRFCLDQADITLWLWSPDHQMTLMEVARVGQDLPLNEMADYRSLEEATGTGVTAFYEELTKNSNEVCLTTAADLWP